MLLKIVIFCSLLLAVSAKNSILVNWTPLIIKKTTIYTICLSYIYSIVYTILILMSILNIAKKCISLLIGMLANKILIISLLKMREKNKQT